MLAARARATSLAALLAVGGFGALATPAHAADGATITLGSDDVWVGDELTITGTCPGGTTSAVVTVEQEDLLLDKKVVNLAPNGSFTADLDLMDAWGGDATASVDCLGYTGSTGRASVDFPIEGDWDFDEIEVALSQQKVALGDTLTVSATCPKGSNLAAVIALNEEADEPFFVQELAPAANGDVSARVKIAATEGVEPEVGNAIAAVFCAEDSSLSVPQLLGDASRAGKLLAGQEPMTALAELEEEFSLTAVGEAEFTITAAAAAPSGRGTVTAPAAAPAAVPAAPTTTRAASAVPQQLAYTGSEPAPLAAIALAMIAAGGVAIRTARRA